MASTKLMLYQTYAEIQTSEIFYNTWHTFEFYMLAGDFNVFRFFSFIVYRIHWGMEFDTNYHVQWLFVISGFYLACSVKLVYFTHHMFQLKGLYRLFFIFFFSWSCVSSSGKNVFYYDIRPTWMKLFYQWIVRSLNRWRLKLDDFFGSRHVN